MEKMQVPKTAAECIAHLRGRITPDEFELAHVLIDSFVKARQIAAIEDCSEAVLKVMVQTSWEARL
jgi:hypothetical protein